MNLSVDYVSTYAKYTRLYAEHSELVNTQEKLTAEKTHTEKDVLHVGLEMHNGFTSMVSSWWGKLVRWSRDTNTDTKSDLYKAKAEEILFDEYKAIEPQVKTNENNIYSLCGKIQCLNDALRLTGDRIEGVVRQIRNLPIDVNKAENTFNLMKSICGGFEAYNQLCQLDMSDKASYSGSIDFITPEMMTSPVMRFVDKFGRQGIAVCMIREGASVPAVQAFFQRTPNSCEWHDGGAKCIPIDGCLIAGGIIKAEAIAILRELITTGECTVQNADQKGNSYTYHLFQKPMPAYDAKPILIPRDESTEELAGSPQNLETLL